MKLTKNQEFELLASISARGEIPVKFVYLDDATNHWDQIYKTWNNDKGVSDSSLELINSHFDGMLNSIVNPLGINVIDLGCRNGIPALTIIDKITNAGIDVTYTAIDISQMMIETSLKNMNNRYDDVKSEGFVVDFEKESLTEKILEIKQSNGYVNLLLNLGNTLGNYINESAVLTNFLEAMTLDDYLLIDNGLTNDLNIQKIIDSYNIPIIIDCVTSPAKYLNIYDPAQDNFKYIWNTNLNRLEGHIKLSSSKTLHLANQIYILDEGDEILVHRSHKHTENTLMQMLTSTGFRTELLTTSKKRDYLLALIQPTRYSSN